MPWHLSLIRGWTLLPIAASGLHCSIASGPCSKSKPEPKNRTVSLCMPLTRRRITGCKRVPPSIELEANGSAHGCTPCWVAPSLRCGTLAGRLPGANVKGSATSTWGLPTRRLPERTRPLGSERNRSVGLSWHTTPRPKLPKMMIVNFCSATWRQFLERRRGRDLDEVAAGVVENCGDDRSHSSSHPPHPRRPSACGGGASLRVPS